MNQHLPDKQYVDIDLAAAKTYNKSLGRLVNSVDQGAALYAAGFDIIIYSGDIW